MMRKRMRVLIACVALAALLGGCASAPLSPAPTAAPTETPAEPVTLTIAGGWPDVRALDVIGNAFTAKYPNCTVEYEYLQDYYASLEKRVTGDDPIDLFVTSNIQSDSGLLPYVLDLYDLEGLDLSGTFEGLIQNFVYRGETEGGKTCLYAIPLGAEMRGMYVNKTLLDSLGIALPTNQETLLAACETLLEAGYIPLHGNPSSFAQTLMYPWICSLIANAEDAEAAYALVSAREPGLSDFFREPFAFLYTLVEKGYYDYKKAQTDLNLFTDTTDEAYARDFLNVVAEGDGYAKADDVGRVAFMPAPMSLASVIAKTKDDYHSQIEYVFMPAPVGTEGGFVYLSPAHGIALCKNSPNVDWGVKFLDFLFQPENNAAFAEAFNVIPNTKEAFSYIRKLFDVPDARISELGQVTFSYDFYSVMQAVLVDMSKANNPKYMQDDGAGNLTLHSLASFMDALEEGLRSAAS